MTKSQAHGIHKPFDKHRLHQNSVVCLMAPTASGKTALVYELYETGRYELISVDSALIYTDMNIGTAKPTEAELQAYPHHLVNIMPPTASYSVANFVADVADIIQKTHQNGKIPLLVGGTMMYYMALFDGISNVPDSNASIRAEVAAWQQAEGIGALYEYLQTVDSLSAQRLKATDSQRISRAIEVYQQTGRPISHWQAMPKQALAHNPQQHWVGFAAMPDRRWLHKRIEQRLTIMWQQGFVAEMLALLNQYQLTANMPSMRCVGYRQLLDYLQAIDAVNIKQGYLTVSKAVDINELHQQITQPVKQQDVACQDMQNKALYATRQLAKRQFTWLKKITKLSGNYNNAMVSLGDVKEIKQFLL